MHPVCGQGILEQIGLLITGPGDLVQYDVNLKINSVNNLKTEASAWSWPNPLPREGYFFN